MHDIRNKYEIHLKPKRGFSSNSVEAYLADLDKLLRFAEDEGKGYQDITYEDLQQYGFLRDFGEEQSRSLDTSYLIEFLTAFRSLQIPLTNVLSCFTEVDRYLLVYEVSA